MNILDTRTLHENDVITYLLTFMYKFLRHFENLSSNSMFITLFLVSLAASFNAVLKRIQRWREVIIVLALYNLQACYNNEIGRGFAGIMTAACCL